MKRYIETVLICINLKEISPAILKLIFFLEIDDELCFLQCIRKLKINIGHLKRNVSCIDFRRNAVIRLPVQGFPHTSTRWTARSDFGS